MATFASWSIKAYRPDRGKEHPLKVLFLAHRLPYPPDSGDKIRALRHLRALVERGHEVHLLALADRAADLRHRAVLSGLCASADCFVLSKPSATLQALRRLTGPTPLSVGYFSSGAMRRAVRNKVREVEFDAVVAVSSTMAQYVPEELRNRCVVDLIDVDSEKWRDYSLLQPPPASWLYRTESERLRRYEQRILSDFVHTVVTTVQEAALIEPLIDQSRVERLHVISHGVDLEYYQSVINQEDGKHPACTVSTATAASSRQAVPDSRFPTVVFVGTMDYYPNVDAVRYFVEQVLPRIREREPRVQFMIVGNRPTHAVRRLEAHPGVIVTGGVADVRPYLAMATVCAVPMRIARGVQSKLLEAMASGRAIVATRETVSALPVDHGVHLLIGRDSAELADAAATLIADEKLRGRLGLAARKLAETEHRWEPFAECFVDLVESAAYPSRCRPESVVVESGRGVSG